METCKKENGWKIDCISVRNLPRLGAQEVLDAVQSLYETQKAITYPRTDCPYLPKSQRDEVPGVLDALSRSMPKIRSWIEGADPTLCSRAWNDAKITAHHAIIPTGSVIDPSRFSDSEKKMHDLICRRYLAQFYPSYQYDKTVVRAEVGRDQFQANGRIEKAAGWKNLFASEAKDEAQTECGLPRMAKGDLADVLAATVQSQKTRPPSYFTEGTLIQAMKTVGKFVEDPQLRKRLRETSGIGTEATRASIIETLFKRGFLAHKGKKSVISTAIGRALIDTLPAAVKDPAVTAVWEQALDEIAEGKRDYRGFVENQIRTVTKLIDQVRSSASEHGLESFQKQAPACPECSKPLHRRKGKNGFFWGCSGYPECTVTFPDHEGKPGSSADRSETCACGGSLQESQKAFQCTACKALVWKETFGKRLTEKQAISLLAGKRIHLKGLTSRNGKRFEADAEIQQGKVTLLFENPRNPSH